MIERNFIKQKKKEYQIQEHIVNSLNNIGHSKTKMQRTPLGEKIIISASRPGLVVGREGKNIKSLTKYLKKKFKLENPQIEIKEVENIHLDANVVAENIASSLERFGIGRFKGVGHKVMANAMSNGALGIEILISGKVPSSRARTWRFYSGYLKKCGDIAVCGVNLAYAKARLKSGLVGIQVRIMPPDIKLPDKIKIIEQKEEIIEEPQEEKSTEETTTETKDVAPEKTTTKTPEVTKEESEEKEESKETKKAKPKSEKKAKPKKATKKSTKKETKSEEWKLKT